MRNPTERPIRCMLWLSKNLSGILGRFFQCAVEYDFQYALRRAIEKLRVLLYRFHIRYFKKPGPRPRISFILFLDSQEHQIDSCLQALLQQTLQHLEIIVISDGATPLQYVSDRRIWVLPQHAKTAGAAWNLGLSRAAGEYVVFMNSSSVFSQDLFFDAYVTAKVEKTDILLLESNPYSSPNRMPLQFSIPEKQPFCHKDCADHFFQITTPSVLGKLFCRKFVLQTNLRCLETCQDSDPSFTYAAMAAARRIASLDGVPAAQASCFTATPMALCQSYLKLHDHLADLNLLDQLRRSYVNAALADCLHSANRIQDAQSRNQIFQELRSSVFSQLELLDHDRTYYYDQEKYLQMLRIMQPEKTTDTSLSVLIPVYNVEKYLEACLDSVLQCSIPNLEIICTNDCSTDGSLEILKRYAKKDSRIKIIDKKKNEGLLHARKSGVEAASNSHIVFLDSDDYVTEGAFEFIQNAILFEPSDIIQFSCGVEDHSGNINNIAWLSKALRASNTHFHGEDVLLEGYVHRSYATTMYGKVFKTELCKKAYALLPEQRCYVGEDILTHFFLSYFAESFTGINTRDFYIYRYGLGVSNNNIMSVAKFENYCQMALWARHIQDTLLTDSASDAAVRSAEAAAFRMFEDCVRAYQTQIADVDLDSAFGILSSYWNSFPFASQYAQEMLGRPLIVN